MYHGPAGGNPPPCVPPTQHTIPVALGRETRENVVAVKNARKAQMRRKSMLGTVLFVLGIMGVIASVAVASLWLSVGAVLILVPGAVMLYQVGRDLG